MKIYFVRHGQTEWNKKGIFQGLSNSDLTEEGIKQAELLSKKLKDINFDAIYSSSLDRAKITANILRGERNLELGVLDEFIEICMGEMEGVEKEVFKNLYPEEQEKFYNDPLNYSPKAYGGESFFEMKERAEKGLNKILKNHKNGENIIVVSHGAILRVLFSYIKNPNLETLVSDKIPKNTSLTEVEYEDGVFTITNFSDISHLENL